MWSGSRAELKRDARRDRGAVERLINHVHIYDLFFTRTVKVFDPPDEGPLVSLDERYPLKLKEYLAQVLMLCWKHALQEAFPGTACEFSYATEPEAYGPTITFRQSEPRA
jgi:hypothetical protein